MHWLKELADSGAHLGEKGPCPGSVTSSSQALITRRGAHGAKETCPPGTCACSSTSHSGYPGIPGDPCPHGPKPTSGLQLVTSEIHPEDRLYRRAVQPWAALCGPSLHIQVETSRGCAQGPLQGRPEAEVGKEGASSPCSPCATTLQCGVHSV